MKATSGFRPAGQPWNRTGGAGAPPGGGASFTSGRRQAGSNPAVRAAPTTSMATIVGSVQRRGERERNSGDISPALRVRKLNGQSILSHTAAVLTTPISA